MKTLSSADILAASPKIVPVPIPELGGAVNVREMSALERDGFDAWITDADGGVISQNLRAKLVICSACDDDGNLLFARDDLAALSSRPSALVISLYRESAKLNRVEAEPEGKAGSGQSENSP